MSQSRSLIEFRNIKKRLKGVLVINIEELCLKRSECVMLRGKNGAGKSTLLKICAGLIAPDTASVIIDGASKSWSQAYRAFRKNVVYLHQMPYLFDRSVADNVAYGLKMGGMRNSEVNNKVSDALQWSGLSGLAERNARELSGGEKQRVALTRARILAPALLLLDEPTTGMDQDSRKQTFGLINNLVGEGIGVCIAMHESAPELAFHRIIEIEQGRIIPSSIRSAGPAGTNR